MGVLLMKKVGLVLEGPVLVRAEWNHSCTSQCPVPCTVNRITRPTPTAGPTLGMF